MNSVFLSKEIGFNFQIISLDIDNYVFMFVRDNMRIINRRRLIVNGTSVKYCHRNVVLVDKNLNFEHRELEMPGIYIETKYARTEKNCYESDGLIFEMKIEDGDIQFVYKENTEPVQPEPCNAKIKNSILHVGNAFLNLRELTNYNLFESYLINQIEKSKTGILRQEDIKFIDNEMSYEDILKISNKLETDEKLSSSEIELIMNQEISFYEPFSVEKCNGDFYVVRFSLNYVSLDERIKDRLYVIKFSELDYEIEEVQKVYNTSNDELERDVLNVLLENLKLEKRRLERHQKY